MQISKREIPFIKNQFYLVLFSILLTAFSIYLIVARGLHFGIDFRGGIKLQYQFSEKIDAQLLQKTVSEALSESVSIQRLGSENENRFALSVLRPKEKSVEEIKPLVTEVLKAKFGQDKVTFKEEKSIGPRAGEELQRKGEQAILVTWILILIYLGFRFDFFFSPGALIALFHDLTIALGAFALMGREVSLTVVAALLTLLGYSVNDTIIVYDRIRENTSKYKGLPLRDLVNRSINETLSRTIVTSLVVFFVVLVLFLRGEGEIQDFAFTMMVGVVTGTYSSIFIASPVYIFLKERFGKEASPDLKPALRNKKG